MLLKKYKYYLEESEFNLIITAFVYLVNCYENIRVILRINLLRSEKLILVLKEMLIKSNNNKNATKMYVTLMLISATRNWYHFVAEQRRLKRLAGFPLTSLRDIVILWRDSFRWRISYDAI